MFLLVSQGDPGSAVEWKAKRNRREHIVKKVGQYFNVLSTLQVKPFLTRLYILPFICFIQKN